jgi:DNA-binding transcriptional LysR family regulator
MKREEGDADYGIRGLSLESIRMFMIAYEEVNFTRAAERSNVALSAFTKRIQNLEYLLQVPLFERHARGVTATSAGDEFAYHVRDILKRLNFARQAIGEFAQGIRGRVRISATPSAIVGGLADDISHFTESHRHIEIELKESDSWSVVPDVENGRSDLGLNMSVMDVPPNMTVSSYRKADLVAIVARSHPLAEADSVTFAELLDYEHISLGERSTLRNFFIRKAEEFGKPFRYRPVSSFDVMRSMVAAGLGVGLMPEMMTRSSADSAMVVAIPVGESWANRCIQVFSRENTLVPASRLFRNFLLNREPSSPAKPALRNR